VWNLGQLSEPKLYWSLDEVRPAAQIPTEQAVKDELWEKLGEAVERQLIADVPVGIFLSGGIDSSVIAAVAQRRRREPLTTFTIAVEDPDFDESAYARTVASHLKTHHIEKLLSRDALFHYVDRALDCLDEPLADPSVLPTYLLSELAREHVKVVLGGDGGDELWSGYPTYWAHHWGNLYGHFPKVLRQGVVSPLVSRLPLNLRYQSFEWKAKRFFLRWDEDSRRRHLRWMSSTDLPLLRRLLPGGPSEPASLADGISLPETDAGNALLALDFKTYLPGSVLAKVDRASMAHGLEVRPPFLDAEIVDFSFSLPSRLKQRKKIGKYLLKAAAQGKLPDEILHRKKKGFGIPLARWLRGPLEARVKRVLAESPAWDGGVLSREAFQLAYDSLVSSREDTSKPLWALLVLDHWMRKESLHVIE
jgi:asparagine synthase (glutamine-hydrolysing)